MICEIVHVGLMLLESQKALIYYSYVSEYLFIYLFIWQPVIPTSPTSSSTTPTSTMGMSSKMENSALQDVYILSPMSGLYGPRYLTPNESEVLKNKVLDFNFTRLIKVGKKPSSKYLVKLWAGNALSCI